MHRGTPTNDPQGFDQLPHPKGRVEGDGPGDVRRPSTLLTPLDEEVTPIEEGLRDECPIAVRHRFNGGPGVERDGREWVGRRLKNGQVVQRVDVSRLQGEALHVVVVGQRGFSPKLRHVTEVEQWGGVAGRKAPGALVFGNGEVVGMGLLVGHARPHRGHVGGADCRRRAQRCCEHQGRGRDNEQQQRTRGPLLGSCVPLPQGRRHPNDGTRRAAPEWSRVGAASGRMDGMGLKQRWRAVCREGVLLDPIGTSNVALHAHEPPSLPGAWLLSVAASLFNVWSLRGEARVVAYPNDSGMHLQMSALASHLLRAGLSPFDHWYPLLSLGSPFFVQYQSLSAVLTGAIGSLGSVGSVYALSLYLLLALWPLLVYASARLLTLERWVAGVAALLSPLLFTVTGRGFGHQSYIWIGSGLWSQLFAMWTLPLAWALSWRWVARREHFLGATVAVSLTISLHFLTGYLALMSVGVWLLIVPSAWRGRLVRAGLLGAAVLLTTLPVTLPIVQHSTWLAVNQFQVGTTINNSYGAPQVVSWLLHGEVFDWHRLPIISVAALIGAGVSLDRWRRDERSRALLGVLTLSMVLFCGRPTFTWLIGLLPGNQNLLLQRYIMGVHLAGLYLAGVGVVSVVRALSQQVQQRAPTVDSILRHSLAGTWLWLGSTAVVAVALVASLPGLAQVAHYDGSSRSLIALQQRADATSGRDIQQLVARALSMGSGRFYAGMPSNWGRSFYVGDVPVYIYLEQLNVDAVGFTLRTSGLVTDPECYFDQNNGADYAMFGVRYLLLPRGSSAPLPAAHLVTAAGPYALWEVNNSVDTSLVQVVDSYDVLKATNATLGPVTSRYLRSPYASAGIYPLIAFAGASPGRPTLHSLVHHFPAGEVTSQQADLVNAQTVRATVHLHRTAVVLVKVAFDPGWQVRVDGVVQPLVMLAPALLGVTVAPGTHHVVFTYHGYSGYPLDLAIAVVTITGVAVGERWWRRRTVKFAVSSTSAR